MIDYTRPNDKVYTIYEDGEIYAGTKRTADVFDFGSLGEFTLDEDERPYPRYVRRKLGECGYAAD